MSTPFLFIHRVLTENVVEVKSAIDSLLEVLTHFVDMTADISTVEENEYTDIKVVIHIKGVK